MIILAVFFGALIYLGLVEYGFCQAPFYQGKTITVVQIVGAGGTGDMRRKALFPFSKSTSREIRLSYLSTCRAEGAERQQITSTESLAPTF